MLEQIIYVVLLVYIYESEINQMTLGEKIKYIRTFRKMTQQELGEAIGLDAKGAANRIAQYETNYRVPKRDMLDNMANILNANYLNFYSPVPGSAEDIMQTLFWIDEENPNIINFIEMKPSNKKYNTGNEINCTYDDNDDMPSTTPVGLWFNYDMVTEFMREWMLRKQALKNKEITQGEYLEWKLNWPDTCDDCRKFQPKKGWRKI